MKQHALILVAAASLAGVPTARAGQVADWSLQAQNTIVGVARKFPGPAAVYMGIVHAAIFDAAVAVEGGYRPYHVAPNAPPGASRDAAVAAAAHRVLAGRFPDQAAALDAAYAHSLEAIPDGPGKQDGIAVGEEVGAGILALRTADGLEDTVPYDQPAPGPGVYEPTAPAIPLGTNLPLVRPLALDSASQFRPDGPLPLGSLAYAIDFLYVKALGRADSTIRTEEQTAVALFWTDHDIPQWNRNLIRLAAARQLGELQTARMLALAHVAGGDAMIACFEAKYHYLSWRPVHAIQRAHTDGNPLTKMDATWQPLRPTPNHPEYPSAHACHTGAVTSALRGFFGTDKVRFALDSLVTGQTRVYDRFKDALREVNRARVWAGFHFVHSDEDGAVLGRKVGREVAERLLRPIH